MTRNRALKTVIRARAARTGERYTTARRHVLNVLEARRGSATPREDQAPTVTPAVRPATAISAKGAVSDGASREETGYGLAHWFDVLDRFGAVQKGHTAAARHLRDVHGVAGWYSQGITVAYERARGVRAVNQRTGGKYEVSASKVVGASAADTVRALVEKRRRTRWAAGVAPEPIEALAAALAAGSKGFAVRADGSARYRYKWDGTTVEIRVTPRSGDKAAVVVSHMGLPSSAAVEVRRGQWRATLAALAEHLAG